MSAIVEKFFSVNRLDDVELWTRFLKKNTPSGSIKVRACNGMGFFGEVSSIRTSTGEQVIFINSSPCVIEKINITEETFAFIYMNMPLQCIYKGDVVNCPTKDTLLINGGERFSLSATSQRNTTTVIFNAARFVNQKDKIIDFFDGRCASSLSFGFLINKIMSDIGNELQSTLQAKVDILISLLVLSTYRMHNPSKHRLNILKQVIKENCHHHDFSVKMLSNITGISLRSIQYTFSQEKIRFKDYLTLLRLELICRNIQETPSRSLADIVMISGFSSVSIASFHFLKKYGESLSVFYDRFSG
ncbi:helix-turn-helix domain-containing protein [Edwardsiella tarda]|uniref:helix-turn-helix domain-containing protein n=1 Tax=Edwardsiella tarda TaxID=636 RepID=UPI003D2ED991